jgi:hypothetical protein
MPNNTNPQRTPFTQRTISTTPSAGAGTVTPSRATGLDVKPSSIAHELVKENLAQASDQAATPDARLVYERRNAGVNY